VGQKCSTTKLCSYASLCRKLGEKVEEEPFATFFLPLLLSLSRDPVINVRLSAGEALSSLASLGPFLFRFFVSPPFLLTVPFLFLFLFLSIEKFGHNRDIAEALKKLKNDPDADVVQACQPKPS